ncbi:hypothetical protein Tco_1055077 [Tanacetum coccineum]|uniref:Uncharacterized protein n=1 Tax=Tanacetum coccineum TaxID=301880 RepID=A0ABQ5GYK0_9ASTR
MGSQTDFFKHKTGENQVDNGGDWVKVTRKLRGNKYEGLNSKPKGFLESYRRYNRFTDFDRVMRNNTTSFFFTNFPDSRDSSALWKTFDRLKNIVDLLAFEGRLKGIFIGGSRLIINQGKFFKDGDRSFFTSDFPPLNPVNRNKTRVFLQQTYRKSFWRQVLQNAWDIVSNNGLVDCNVKYVGGLSLLFEWNSKEAAIQSLEFKFVWLQKWFDDLKLWEDNGDKVGRLTWLNIEGLSVLARNLGAIKSVLLPFGKVLEVGHLDFNSKALSLVKSLVLTDRMDDLNQNLSVLLNGRIYPIRIFEEQFHTYILFPSSAPSSKFDDSDSVTEEEYVGPSMTAHGEVDGEGDGESKDDDSYSRASERSPLAQYPKFMSRVAGSSSPKADPIYDNMNSLSPHANFGGSSNMESKSNGTFSPISSNGLPQPSPYDQYSA